LSFTFEGGAVAVVSARQTNFNLHVGCFSFFFDAALPLVEQRLLLKLKSRLCSLIADDIVELLGCMASMALLLCCCCDVVGVVVQEELLFVLNVAPSRI
jgi:hypothetical protein